MMSNLRRTEWWKTQGKALFLVLTATGILCPITASGPWTEGRAVSLRVLQEILATDGTAAGLPTEARNLGGITRPRGYLLDARSQDVILYGEHRSGDPPLYVEDLVAALRNAWRRYARIESDLRIYQPPGCSLDPAPDLVDSLRALVARGVADLGPAADAQFEADWATVCRRPQRVVVHGIPFRSHFARVMLEADYAMKSLADGSDSLAVPGFRSYRAVALEELQASLIADRRLDQTQGAVNRFWFHNAHLAVVASDQGARLDSCGVGLLTEAEYRSGGDRLEEESRVSPSARVFCESLTQFYPQIARERPVFRALKQLFELHALTVVMHERGCFSAAQLEPTVLLDKWTLPDEVVPASLPGKPTVSKVRVKKTRQGQAATLTRWWYVCGGVDMTIPLTDQTLQVGPDVQLEQLAATILRARGGSQTLVWAYGDSTQMERSEGQR